MDFASITDEQYMQALEDVVDERGSDFVYDSSESCQYVRNGESSCLVGAALFKLGVPLETLSEWDSRVSEGRSSTFDDIAPEGVSPRIVRAYTVAQSRQDCNETYGEALQGAREVFARS